MEIGHHSDAEVSYHLAPPTILPTSHGIKKKNTNFPRFRSKHESNASSSRAALSRLSDKPMTALEHGMDDESDQEISSDEFGVLKPLVDDQSIVTGRMRKRHVARSKGGEFRAHRQKRRLYTCCISETVRLRDLYHHLARDIFSSKSIWRVSILSEVLILSKCRDRAEGHDYETADDISISLHESINLIDPDNQAVFVFEFGAVVFWGFSNGEERNLLNVFRRYSPQEQLYKGSKFQKGEDDMAFVSSIKQTDVTVSNDVIVLPSVMTYPLPHPGGSSPSYFQHQSSSIMASTPSVTYELLLAVSYAIAQSTVVSIFEHRIEMKITEYKFIPETLARGESVNLSDDKLGMMIGDIFQIKHDLNLHTDILDIPDVLWAANDEYLTLYDRMIRYLEVESRVEVINKRINMQKEILDMLQHHFHSDHISNLNTIIIWLLAIEVVVQVFGGGGMLLGFWG